MNLTLIEKNSGLSLEARREQNENIVAVQDLSNSLESSVGTLESSVGTLESSVGTLESSVGTLDAAYSAKVKHTPEGGIAVKLTNRSGSASVKGYCVDASPAYDHAVKLTAIGVPDCIGVFLDSGVADGQEAWVVVSGIADVYFFASSTRGHMARLGIASDTGEVAGQALSEEVPSSPFATDKHFAEIGHVIGSRTGAGLAKVILHFN